MGMTLRRQIGPQASLSLVDVPGAQKQPLAEETPLRPRQVRKSCYLGWRKKERDVITPRLLCSPPPPPQVTCNYSAAQTETTSAQKRSRQSTEQFGENATQSSRSIPNTLGLPVITAKICHLGPLPAWPYFLLEAWDTPTQRRQKTALGINFPDTCGT